MSNRSRLRLSLASQGLRRQQSFSTISRGIGLSMHQATTNRWSLDEDVAAYRRAGYEGIGIWRPKLVEFGEERAVDLLRDSDLTVTSLGWIGGFTGRNGTYVEAVEDAIDAIYTAASLRARSVTVVSGDLNGHITPQARRCLVDGLSEVADLAGELNIRLALQPMHRIFARNWSFIHTLDDALEIVRQVGHPSVGLAFGTYQLSEEDRLIERIKAICPYIVSVQLSDSERHPRSQYDRAIPGTGNLPIAEMLYRLHQGGYRGPYEIDVWSRELWKSDYDALLKQCHENVTRLWQSSATCRV